MGNDLVRFIDGIIRRPTIVSGLSSGGVLSAWRSAYAKPGQIRGAHYEDPPLFHSEVDTSCGQSLRQAVGPTFALWSKYRSFPTMGHAMHMQDPRLFADTLVDWAKTLP